MKIRDVEFKFAETLESAKNARVYHAVSGVAVSPDKPSEKIDKLKRLLTSEFITPTERSIIVLFYYEALTDAQIAGTLDLPEDRVRQIRIAVIERLKANLAAK